ncbi:archaeosortase A [Halomicrobium sp. LC1Hm]|uniref:archaeosortase A n=1 Tax=Halomicrobium sp. LC1Hm TaxID=2610902 RepID=UPI0012984E19|nr:archaeosortase A [Halomicrobium sp. LC1Hm]QGA82330.1 Exosortase [Halomicrobium sp. LC1Hm]
MVGAAPLTSVVGDPLAVARPLSWLLVISFLATGVLAAHTDARERARQLGALTWGVFGLFWLVLVPHFVLVQKSIVEGIGSIAAVPLSLYVGYLLWNGRDSLFTLSKAIGYMGLLYLPFTYLPLLESNPLRKWMIEVVAAQTGTLLSLIGVEPELVRGTSVLSEVPSSDYSYLSTFYFPGNERPITYTIIVACTGVGSISILAGAILAVEAPLGRKARALAVSVPVIYGLNLVRNVFIATMFGQQRMQWFVGTITGLFGTADEQMVSYYIADRLLAQFGSVIALVGITWLVVKVLPEILSLVDDVAYLVTGTEYDLREELTAERD